MAELLDRLSEAAAALQDPAVADLVASIREHQAAAKLQIAVLGSTGAGRAALVNGLLACPDLLPSSAIPKAPLSLLVRYGPTRAVQVVDEDGNRAVLPPARLRSFLLDPANRARRVEVEADCELLKTCDLRVEALDAKRSPEAWRSLLARCDFAILVLKAPALLSQAERSFVREHLAPYGLHRTAIVLNQMDVIPEEERDSLPELVRVFLGPFETQPALLELSALHPEDGTGLDALRLLAGDLVEQHAALRASALRHDVMLAVQALEGAARREQGELSLGAQEAQALQASLQERTAWLQERCSRTQQRAGAFIGTLLRERLQREVTDFGAVFRGRLPEEVLAVDDLAAIKRYLPGYIETVWRQFLRDRMIAVQSDLSREAVQIERLIEADLADLLPDAPAGVRSVLTGFNPDPGDMHPFISPRRGRHPASGVARGLSLHAGIMLLFFAAPELGVLSLGVSHLVRRIYKKGIATSDKEAIVQAAAAASKELERELEKQIADSFARLDGQVKEEIAGQYGAAVGRLEEFLADAASRRQTAVERQGQLDRLRRETIPELRQLLNGLDVASVA